MKISYKNTKNIYDFVPIIEPLIEDFDKVFLDTVLIWCKIMSDDNDKRFWQVWLITSNNTPIGICGLYSLNNSTEELWLGWLGIVPEYRNKGLGVNVMNFLYSQARGLNCKRILSYVDKKGKPLSFYKREGFQIIGNVKKYLQSHKNISLEEFEDLNDYIIKKEL